MKLSIRHQRESTIYQRGFTLVEAIVVMVITGILAGIMVLFIRRPVQNYTDAAARAELSDAADLALRRMARELRTALPNSVRLTGSPGNVWWLEFIPTTGGGQYLTVENNPDPVKGTPLSFTSTNAQTFNVIGSMPAITISPGGAANFDLDNFIVVYNLGSGFTDADAYDRSNLALITAVNNRAISFESYAIGAARGNTTNPFAEWTKAPPSDNRMANTSPAQRFQVVKRPVIFRCQGSANGRGTLTRSVVDFSSSPTFPNASAGILMANNVVDCDFSIGFPANQQSALVGLNLSLGRPNPDGGNAVETVTLTHQIHVDNIP
jgi:MSHA biogenesis protein MshO